MEPSHSDDIDQLSLSSLRMGTENSSTPSLANTSTPDYDSDEESDRSSRQPTSPTVGRGVVPFHAFKGYDTSFRAIHIPPENTEITSYSELFNHFQQSPLFFEAFQRRFCIIPL